MARRRGRGEGSIYQRGDDGRWVGSVTLEATGKRRSVTGKTRQEVQRKLSLLRREIEQGLTPGDGRQTVAQYLAGWLDAIKPPKTRIGEAAWERHEEYVRLHIVPRIGRVKLVNLTPQMVQGIYGSLLAEDGLSGTTVQHLHGSLHKALDMAVRQGLVARNVADLVDAPRMAEHEIHPLTREQARRLMVAAEGERLYALIALALSVGMRLGELLALHWGDIEMQHRALSVRWSLRYKHGEFTFKEPKTKKSRRRILLSGEMEEVLRAHRTRQKAERLKAGELWQENDLVFCSGIGTPLSPGGSVRSSFRRLKRLAELPEKTRFHDLRHTCATLALTDRVNPKVVSEMLGHAKVGTTLDIYAHVIPDMQRDVATVMGRLIFSDPHPLDGLSLVSTRTPDAPDALDSEDNR